MRKHLFLMTALIIGIIAALTVQIYSGKPNYPVVRALLPGGVTLTFVGNPWNDANRCAKENQTVTDTLRQQCPKCRIEFSGCHEQLNSSWEKSFLGEPSDQFTVHTDTQKIVIESDPKTSREVCIGMASQIEQLGKLHARCVEPAL